MTKNAGYVFVGTSADTPEFAVDALVRWWKDYGCVAYPGAAQLLILADGGGCNGYRSRAWKHQLQEKVSDQLGLTVTVCHYPPGCSKWNPIEHRLFSYISLNWAGRPLRTLEIMLGYIRGTTTATGLSVKAFLQRGSYKKGQKVTAESMNRLSLALTRHVPIGITQSILAMLKRFGKRIGQKRDQLRGGPGVTCLTIHCTASLPASDSEKAERPRLGGSR